MKKYLPGFLLLLLASVATGQTEKGNVFTKFGKGVNFTAADSSMSLKLSARFQTLFVAERLLTDGAPIEKELMVRRARLKFDGFAFSPRLEYKIELGLSNRDNGKVINEGNNGANIVLDAVLKYSLSKHTELWFGQTKLPGNRERVISSQKLQFVDRSLVNSAYNLDRDIGFQLHHKTNIGNVVLKDQYAIALGQGRDITASDTGGFSYTGRFEILPMGEFTGGGDYFESDLAREEKPKLSLGAGYSFNNNAMRKNGELGSFLKETRNLKTFFADVVFKYQGWSVSSEYMNKRSDNSPILKDGTNFFNTGDGWNIQSGYLFKNNIELAGRYTVVNPSDILVTDSKGYQIKEYTLGMSKYLSGHNLKIQTDLGYIKDYKVTDGALRYRFQVEMAF